MKYELILGCKHYPLAVLCFSYLSDKDEYTLQSCST